MTGVLRLGRMWSVVAKHLSAASFRAKVYDPAGYTQFEPIGIKLLGGGREVAEGGDFILVPVGFGFD